MNIDNYQAKRLDRQEFASALQKGLGRAFLHVKQYGLDGVSDLVLQACLHDQTYDPQSEGSKAKWLFSMFCNASYYYEFSESILDALGTDTDTWDLQQLFELAREMALLDNKRARESIRERALKIASQASSDDWLGALEWMEIGGIEGMLELVRIYGQRLLANPKDFVPEKEVFPEYTVSRKYKIILAKHAQREPAIKAYLDHIKKRGAPSRRSSNLAIVNTNAMRLLTKEEAARLHYKRIRSEYSLSSIMNDAKNKIGTYPGYYTSFGKCATREELETIYSALLKEKDDDVRLRLLWVFRRAQIPFLDESLFVLANGKDEKLKEASLNALAQITDPRVHELAKHKVVKKQLLGADTAALKLFINNYDTEDAKIIIQALLSIKPNREDAHSLVWNIIEIAKHYNDTALVDALKWGYEITPCSNCRHRVVAQLDILNHFNGYILHECQFDSDKDISELARKRLGSVI